MVLGSFKLFVIITALVFLSAAALFFGIINLNDLNFENILNTLRNPFPEKNPDIRGDIVSGSIKARNIEGDIKGGEDIKAERIEGNILNGSNIEVEVLLGDIKGGEDIKADLVIGEVSGGKNIEIETLIGENKIKNSSSIKIKRIIEKETVIKEIC